MMRVWIQPLLRSLEGGEAAMLVHVAELQGSGPREVGAQMLVTESGLHGTIGGGELEHTATFKARELLASGGAALLRFALVPELNQCCGGSVTLAFEPFAPADLAWTGKLAAAAAGPEPVFRTVRLDAAGAIRRDWEIGGDGADYHVAADFVGAEGLVRRSAALSVEARKERPRSASPGTGEAESERSSEPGEGPGRELRPSNPHPVAGATRSLWFRERKSPPGDSKSIHGVLEVTIRERVNPVALPVWLFGAGHVGRAVAQALHPLGFALTWIDGRARQLPESPLDGVRQLALAMPELIVDEAPPGACFLVMTHSHPLDEAICEAVLRRGDFSYLGLIGSKTKRARFRKRLAEAGLPRALVDRMACPIGLPDIKSKDPAAIAASVAADLLIRRERNLLRAGDTVAHG